MFHFHNVNSSPRHNYNSSIERDNNTSTLKQSSVLLSTELNLLDLNRNQANLQPSVRKDPEKKTGSSKSVQFDVKEKKREKKVPFPVEVRQLQDR